MDQHSMGEKGERGESLEAPRPVIEPRPALQITRFSLPRLRHFDRADEERQSSDGSEDAMPVSQQIDTQGNSDAARGTPLLPTPLELGAGNNTGLDVFRHVPLASIITGDRLRGVVDASISKLMDSVAELGVIHPPTIRPHPTEADAYILVSGLQRINAAKALGKDTMLCRVVGLDEIDATLWEADENLARAGLGPAEEALFMKRRREAYELRHGKGNAQAKGAAAANARQGRRHAAAMLARASFSEDTANQTGRSQRTIQRALHRADQNGSATLARVAGTSLDTGAELDALPHLPPATRKQLIEQAVAGAQVSAVQARKQLRESPAAKGLDTTEALPPPDLAAPEIDAPDLSALKKVWLGASTSARESFLAWIEVTK